jgi:hypothetical protein
MSFIVRDEIDFSIFLNFPVSTSSSIDSIKALSNSLEFIILPFTKWRQSIKALKFSVSFKKPLGVKFFLSSLDHPEQPADH